MTILKPIPTLKLGLESNARWVYQSSSFDRAPSGLSVGVSCVDYHTCLDSSLCFLSCCRSALLMGFDRLLWLRFSPFIEIAGSFNLFSHFGFIFQQV